LAPRPQNSAVTKSKKTEQITLQDARKLFNIIRINTSRTSKNDPYAINPVREYLIPLDIIKPDLETGTDRAGGSSISNIKVAEELQKQNSNTGKVASRRIMAESPVPMMNPSPTDAAIKSPLSAPKPNGRSALPQAKEPSFRKPIADISELNTTTSDVKVFISTPTLKSDDSRFQKPEAHNDRSGDKSVKASPIPGLGGIAASKEHYAGTRSATDSEKEGSETVKHHDGGEDSGKEMT